MVEGRHLLCAERAIARLLMIVMAGLITFGLTGSTASAGSPSFCQESKRSETSLNHLASSETLPPRSASPRGVVLITSKKVFSPGDVAFARLFNFSQHIAGYGREFSIQRYGPSGWSLDPASPKGPWARVRHRLQPGSAGRCFRFRIPAGQPQGKYRFSTEVYTQLGTRKGPAKKIAEFSVR